MLAAAFLASLPLPSRPQPSPAGNISLTGNEIPSLFAAVTIKPAHDTWHWMRWSRWRRHQCRAQICHYQDKRPRPVKVAICNWSTKRWWYGLLQREPGLFARWA